MNNESAVRLVLASASDIERLETYVAAFHAFEDLDSSAETRRESIIALIERPELGRIWLIEEHTLAVGYIVLCFGFSIEFAGRDAFVDEFFIDASARGRGIGRIVLEQLADAARDFEVQALHLEVAKDNTRASGLYSSAQFRARTKYQLMTRSLLDD